MPAPFLLLALLALVPGGQLGGPQARPHEPPARLEVLEGRVSVALQVGVLRLEAGSPTQLLEGPTHLEVSAASRARVGWSGSGSLVLDGRTVLEWRRTEGSAPTLAWKFAESERARLEVRRGAVRLELPGGWRGLLGAGAFSVRGLPDGTVEFHHGAGLPVTLWPPLGDGQPQPPYTVLPGASVRLLREAGRPVALPGSANQLQEPHAKLGFEARASNERFPAWEGFSWPWRAAHEAPPATAQRRADEEGLLEGGPPAEPAPDAPGADRPADGSPAGGGERIGSPRLGPWPYGPVRREGELVLTPYGPRWVDVVRILSELRRPRSAEPAPR